MKDKPSPKLLQIAGGLLLGGGVVFWAGAFTPPYRWWFGISVKEFLELVHAHQGVWLWIAAAFATGVLLTLAGLVVLGRSLRAAGDRMWTDLGQNAFLLGGILWLASLAFRATATVMAARQTAQEGVPPGWFEPMRMWSGGLFAVYMLLAYLAIAAYGRALRSTRIMPRWVAQFHLWFGLCAAVGFLARVPVFNPPLMVHLPLIILGVALMRPQRKQQFHE